MDWMFECTDEQRATKRWLDNETSGPQTVEVCVSPWCYCFGTADLEHVGFLRFGHRKGYQLILFIIKLVTRSIFTRLTVKTDLLK